MNCQIITTIKNQLFKNLISLTLPGSDGQMEILPGHAEAFFKLNPGEVVLITHDAPASPISIPESVCYIQNNQVLIIG